MIGAYRMQLFAAVAVSGAAALIWEVLWQHHTALALGVSTYGTAITLASLMTGFAIGGYLAHRLASRRWMARPLVAYGACEIAIAVLALIVPAGLLAVSVIDAWLFAVAPALAPAFQLVGTALLLIPPATAMGATIPILAACTDPARIQLGRLYGINIAGAVIGILLGTFVAIPRLGIFWTGVIAAALELAVAVWAFGQSAAWVAPKSETSTTPSFQDLALSFASGFAVFCLELSWFRSVRAAYQSTTETFAIVLAGFLLPLALGAWLARPIRGRFPAGLSFVLPLAGFAVLCAGPWIERLDRFAPWADSPAIAVIRFVLVLALMGFPITLMGIVFPWLIERAGTVSAVGRLYTANTIGAVAGALVGAFVLLPTIGAARTSGAIALLLVAAGLATTRRLAPALVALGLAAAGLFVAVELDSGAGRTRVQGTRTEPWKLLSVDEGPDSTVAVVETASGVRTLIIDGFVTANEARAAHYMEYMGHLPALASRKLQNALVICFGTGQTANAVRRHGPERLDIVDVNPAVLRAAPLFPSNRAVLEDPRVRATVMDGRAWLRRGVGPPYDLITLEPMAPMFAGTNNLYSIEFYELARRRLAPGGIVAQWLPFHLVPPSNSAAIAATFQKAFPYSRLFVDPMSTTGILVGGVEPWSLRPSTVPLDLDRAQIDAAFVLDEDGVRRLARGAPIISDDNQYLSQLRRSERARNPNLSQASLEIIAAIRAGR